MDRTKVIIIAGAVLWPSFILSVGASIFFFSMFDPELLGQITTWPIQLERGLGYTVGFFLFWFLTMLSSLTSTWLIITQHHKVV